ARIESLNALDDWKVCIYTARPSGPPPDAGSSIGFSPEAEFAIELCGIASGAIPLIGMGMMEWLASKSGCGPEDLTKPNTTQACAALAACVNQSSNSRLLSACYEWVRDPENTERHYGLFS